MAGRLARLAMSARPRTYVRDGFKLVQTDHPDSWMKYKGCYQVIADGVGFVGTVGAYMERFERRPHKGARYVIRRWRSQRWWSELPGEVSHRRGRGFEGPGEAAKSLIWRAEQAQADKQRARQ